MAGAPVLFQRAAKPLPPANNEAAAAQPRPHAKKTSEGGALGRRRPESLRSLPLKGQEDDQQKLPVVLRRADQTEAELWT